jgi:hypothetical protein
VRATDYSTCGQASVEQIFSEPHESYDLSALAGVALEEPLLVLEAVCVRLNGTCVSDTGTYAIVVWTFCTSAHTDWSLESGRTSSPPLAVAKPGHAQRKDAQIYTIGDKATEEAKGQAIEYALVCMHGIEHAKRPTDASL